MQDDTCHDSAMPGYRRHGLQNTARAYARVKGERSIW